MSESVSTLQRLALELIAAKRPSDEILDRLCELVQEIVPNGLATTMRFNARENTLTFRNAPSAPACVLEAFGTLTPGPFSGSCGSSVHERRMVAVESTATDPRWESLRSVAETYNIRACWSVPIFVSEDEIAGTFAISRTVEGVPTEEQRSLLELAAYLAGIVLRLEQADARVNEQNRTLQAILDCAEDPIFVKDRNGRYQVVNDAEARHFGVTPQEMVGKTDNELYADANRPPTEGDVRTVIEKEQSVVREIEVVSPGDGVTRQFHVRKDPLRDENGNILGIVGISRDITERRRVERAMQQAQKLESLGVLAGGIAHDFNNLLVGILANASMLEETDHQDLSAEDLKQGLTDIRKASERASELTNQLLQYAGKRKPECRTLDVPDLVEELPDLLTSSISKRVAVRTEIGDELPSINADPVQIRQVLMNLVLNAADAMEGRTGKIVLRASLERDAVPTGKLLVDSKPERRDWVLFEVRDDGIGMTQETQARIFDPFFTTKTTGRGLGLAAVLGIVCSHGGCMDVQSRPGAGTTFRIWLPADAQTTSVTIPTAVRSAPTANAGQRVLIVEDEGIVGRTLARMLKREGNHVTLAEDGLRGLDEFHSGGVGAFDLVILDYTMPGIDGFELAHRVRELDPGVPIVMMSGLADAEIERQQSPGDIDAFLCKPFSSKNVSEAIEAAKSGRQGVLS